MPPNVIVFDILIQLTNLTNDRNRDRKKLPRFEVMQFGIFTSVLLVHYQIRVCSFKSAMSLNVIGQNKCPVFCNRSKGLY